MSHKGMTIAEVVKELEGTRKKKHFVPVFSLDWESKFFPMAGQSTITCLEKTSEQVVELLKPYDEVYVNCPFRNTNFGVTDLRVLDEWLTANGFPTAKRHDVGPLTKYGLDDALVFMPRFTFQPGSLLSESVDRWLVCQIDRDWAAKTSGAF